MELRQRKGLVQATSWYWECGQALLQNKEEDAQRITAARQIIVTKLLERTLKSVSIHGEATQKKTRIIYDIIWGIYLDLMFGGILNEFRKRIEKKHSQHPDCMLAMIDTCFYVVILDLLDVSKSEVP